MSKDIIKKLTLEINKHESLEDKELKIIKFQLLRKSMILKVVLRGKEKLAYDEEELIKKIICNKCGREIPAVDGSPREGVFSIDYTWGYFSEKDGERHSFDRCESCYAELLASFQIPATIEE